MKYSGKGKKFLLKIILNLFVRTLECLTMSMLTDVHLSIRPGAKDGVGTRIKEDSYGFTN